MIVVIDNYDSFVHNLARYFTLSGAECLILRNDEKTVSEIAELSPEAIVISPGPCAPKDSGICIDLIRELSAHTPIFGVCLGHQCIAEAYGGQTVRAEKPVHGQSSYITHSGKGLFDGLKPVLKVGRYHSLISDIAADSPLKITAQTEDGIAMAIEHETHPVYGVQFHPESILTDEGLPLIGNFLKMAAAWNAQKQQAA